MSAAEAICRRPSLRPTTCWDTNDLRRRLVKALDAAHRAVLVLGPDGYRAGDANGVRPEKILSETAIFLLGSHHQCVTDPELAPRHRRVCEALIPYARNDRVAALIVLEPTITLDHALIHLCLSRMGFEDQRFDQLVGAAQPSRLTIARERLPHRVMEQSWLSYLAGAIDARSFNFGHDSILSGSLDALSMSADDAYAFTHALMFGSALGMRKLKLPRSAADIVADAEIALGCFLDDEDYDVAGELLLTWPLLASRWSAAATFGFICLAHVEDQAGFLPAPSISLDELAKLKGEERSRYAMAMTYHTIYVMGLLCALLLKPEKAPPSEVPGTRRYRGAAAALAEIPDPDEHTPRHWENVFAGLEVAQQESLSPLLLAIKLRRAARRRDLARIQDLLRVAARFDLLDGPAPDQALELLQRSALLHQLGLTSGS